MVSETAVDVGAALRAARERAGNPSFSTIERALVIRLGPETAPRAETIRTYHRGGGPNPTVMNLELVEALADYYECAVAALSPTVAERLSRLLVGNRKHGIDTARSTQPVAA